ncbi:hypothetical protein [uncultured Roseivirga sp.]|uniref:hypothetical protein n=1 Tax=uncultured Roseivirga sp. TaxID=543088 RepID=UPI0030DA7EE5|tara:strand:+ start:63404 stop:63910 length:507 start_codon:yes stop_codon:yes gene_type:complete
MKKLTMLLSIVLMSACGGGTVNDNSTAEKLAQTVLSAIKENDPDRLSDKYFTNASNLKEHYKTLLELDADTDRQLERMIENLMDMPVHIEDVRKRFSQKGLSDWSDVEFSKINFEDVSRNNVKVYSRTMVEFTNGEFGGVIGIGEMTETEDGWKLTTAPRYSQYGRNF